MNTNVTNASPKVDKGTRPDRPEVEIEVNNQTITVQGPRLTASEIKQAAIAQDVQIQPDFVLSELLSNGKSRILGDDDTVTVNRNSKFRAIANDDNS